MDFTDAHLAPHTELQCSVFVERQPIAPLPAHPFALLKHMIDAPDAGMLCADIWNNTAECVAYNREHLGLGAKLCQSNFTRDKNSIAIHFRDDTDTLLDTKITLPSRTGFGDTLSLMRFFGLKTLMEFARSDYVTLDVINRISDVISQNLPAQTYTVSDKTIVKPFDPATDTLTFGDIPFANIDFKPDFVQYVDGIKFVYLDPQR